MSQQYSDRQIIDGIKLGNDAILKYWYNRDYSYISSYILKNNGTLDDAKELFQDAFMVVYQKIVDDTFKLNASIKTFLYAVARNLWLKKLRDNSKLLDVTDDINEVQMADITPEYDWETDEQEQKIIEQLNKLGANCQKILKFYYFDKKRLREITKLLSYKDEKSAKNAKYKCMQQLRKFFNT